MVHKRRNFCNSITKLSGWLRQCIIILLLTAVIDFTLSAYPKTVDLHMFDISANFSLKISTKLRKIEYHILASLIPRSSKCLSGLSQAPRRNKMFSKQPCLTVDDDRACFKCSNSQEILVEPRFFAFFVIG